MGVFSTKELEEAIAPSPATLVKEYYVKTGRWQQIADDALVTLSVGNPPSHLDIKVEMSRLRPFLQQLHEEAKAMMDEWA
jgi:hypothetical protein